MLFPFINILFLKLLLASFKKKEYHQQFWNVSNEINYIEIKIYINKKNSKVETINTFKDIANIYNETYYIIVDIN